MIRNLIAATLAATALAATPAHADTDWLRTGCTTKPSGLLKCAVVFTEADMHRLDVTYSLRGVEHYDTTSKQGSRSIGASNTYAARVAPGLRLTCEQDGSRISCVVNGRRAYAVRFYNQVGGEFYNWGGGGVR